MLVVVDFEDISFNSKLSSESDGESWYDETDELELTIEVFDLIFVDLDFTIVYVFCCCYNYCKLLLIIIVMKDK